MDNLREILEHLDAIEKAIAHHIENQERLAQFQEDESHSKIVKHRLNKLTSIQAIAVRLLRDLLVQLDETWFTETD